MHFFRPGWVQYLIFGVRLQDFFGWGQPIFSAAAGTVVQAQDGWPERNPVHPVRDFLIRVRNARAFTSNQTKNYRILSGNFVIVETSDGYAVYAHAQTGSIAVSLGEEVTAGQRLANVGHSGNSTAPHLHFQMMDHPDPWQARGLPCSFREYEVFQDGAWHLVQDGIPGSKDRIRKR
jgi:murein DD-endopeptidase MepM/ murein hydrolase activator NlpD